MRNGGFRNRGNVCDARSPIFAIHGFVIELVRALDPCRFETHHKSIDIQTGTIRYVVIICHLA